MVTKGEFIELQRELVECQKKILELKAELEECWELQFGGRVVTSKQLHDEYHEELERKKCCD